MIKAIEGYADNKKRAINTKKTKIMIFLKGRRRAKKSNWKYKGQMLEEVQIFKYSGFWFSNGNSWTKHTRLIAERSRKAVNANWGLLRRTRRNRLKDRL